jgi:1,4-alpha-glucan branching enzyme
MKKTYSKSGKVCRVTFELPADANLKSAALCGEFNNWDKTQHELIRRKKGNFSLTISLDAGKEYRFRYWVDGERWENDWKADKYIANEFGTEDSVIVL